MTKSRVRSMNSDLLLPEFMEAQIQDLIKVHAEGSAPFKLHRLTVFVTHKCNLFCDYCTGPHLTWRDGDSERKRVMLREDLTTPEFRRYFNELVERCAEIDHVHFTGGEASMKPELADMVEAVSREGCWPR